MVKDLLVARAIHAASVRRDGPFVKVNCAAIPLQAKLLHVRQDLRFARVGGHEVIEVGEFREDLSDRLNVVEIRAK